MTIRVLSIEYLLIRPMSHLFDLCVPFVHFYYLLQVLFWMIRFLLLHLVIEVFLRIPFFTLKLSHNYPGPMSVRSATGYDIQVCEG
jgi:hypothetical protein